MVAYNKTTKFFDIFETSLAFLTGRCSCWSTFSPSFLGQILLENRFCALQYVGSPFLRFESFLSKILGKVQTPGDYMRSTVWGVC